uniref:Heat shock 70 kDa protein 12B n=1 Tax=Magallana gigas TaxID=29159 RepID=K1RKH3_MAGGI
MDDTKCKDYLIVGAIDFGTTFSGYAFSTKHDFLTDPKNIRNISIKHWEDPISAMLYYKTSTCILFTEEKIFDKFGFEAEAKYLDLILDNDHQNWYFFRRFKMSLYAIQAGIDSSMLTIALEPEAAALYVKDLPVEKRICENKSVDFETFAPGSKYIVVDVGGGTVDITAHEVLEDGHVEELIKATGGNWGGTKVDEEYMDFIKRLIGENTAKYIDENIPSVFFEACREFEMAKRTIKPNSDGKFNVRIPSQIGETYSLVHCGRELKSVKTVITKYEKHMVISFTGDKLRLKSKDAEDFFAESITKIANYLSELILQNGGKDITTIILVGGYAESRMLIEGIKTKFSHMRVIIPTEAAWSILLGAVIFGHSPNLIKHRRSKYTYGICVNKKFKPSEHDEKHKYEDNGDFRCWGLFSKLVEIDEIVSVGEYRNIDRNFHIKNCKEEGNFKLYASTLKYPKYVDEEECFFIGHILSPGHEFLPKHIIYIDVCFGETQIMFLAQQPKSDKFFLCYLGD